MGGWISLEYNQLSPQLKLELGLSLATSPTEMIQKSGDFSTCKDQATQDIRGPLSSVKITPFVHFEKMQ